ncbi:hypothetical protein RB195_005918 [Necator americanus]|uniref:Uncharacterized protein n=1 Tax=Necator americanus TaxID=51031 RepID=A0ABR1BS13_NECAM
MFRLISGYSIAKHLGRKLFFSLNGGGDQARVRVILARITATFPRTFQAYTLFSPCIESTVVPFVYDSVGRRTCCVFADPMRYSSYNSKFLVLDTEYGQNVRYFEENLSEIREMFTFGDEAKERGDNIVNCMKMTDFLLFNASSDFNKTLEAALQIGSEHRINRYLLFGDDKVFMNDLAGNLMKYDNGGDEVIAQISDYDEFDEFYVASRACAAFIITAPTSTFGWWLAFFTSNQEAVYYINDTRPLMSKKATDETFLRSWKAFPP